MQAVGHTSLATIEDLNMICKCGMKRLIFSPSLRNLTRRSWFERSLLLSWEVAMSTYLVLVVVLSVARLAGTVARKMRRTRTSDYVVGFMQQRPSRLRDMCRQRGKGIADDMLFIEHSHQMEKGVSAFFIIRIRASCSFLQVSPSFFLTKKYKYCRLSLWSCDSLQLFLYLCSQNLTNL